MEIKICQNCHSNFIIEPDDFSFYEKIKVPPPTFCPECRAIRRMSWRNERSLFKRQCDFKRENIITMFHPESDVIVYDKDIWWSDKWDPSEYGQDYDFSRPFFEQYKELLAKVPLQNLGNNNCVNSSYGNHNADCKNCYLTYASYLDENVMYSHGAANLKDCLDTYAVQKSEQCYEDIICNKLFKTHFSYNTEESINSYFLKNCINCQDCIGCINLVNKKYCIFNKQYTKEEYFKQKEKLNFGSYNFFYNFKIKYQDFCLRFPNKYGNIIKSIDVSGDNISHTKNCKSSFDLYGDIEDSKYVVHGLGAKDSWDIYGFGAGAYLLYEGVDIGIKGSNNYFAVLNHGCVNTNYTYMCYNSHNLFGCIGIRKGEYYILNKKYLKEEYEKLISKIKQHMIDMPYVDIKGRIYKYGEFFPVEISPFTYNETITQEYFPKTKTEINEQGYLYRETLERDYKITIKSKDLPDHIKDVKDNIIDEIIACPNNGSELTQCTKAYKITPEELSFLKRHNIAIPRFCPNCRHYERLHKRNPMKLWHRKCMKEGCDNEFETSYAPERPEIVFCEKCYQQEVY